MKSKQRIGARMISAILDRIFPSRVEKRNKRKAIIRQIKATKEGMAKIEELMNRLDEPHKNGLPHALMYMAAQDKLRHLKWELERL